VTGAWYASGGSRARDLWTLLHPPYTSMVLGTVVIGAALSPVLHVDRLVGLLVAYLLGLGGAAHFLDEARGHPWGTGFSTSALYVLAALTLIPAVGIGIYFAHTVDLLFLPFVILGTFFALAYNLEWFGGFFHTDPWFAFSWGALPFLTSHYLQMGMVAVWAVPLAGALACTAGVQISLSRWVKGHRRRAPAGDGSESSSGLESVDIARLIARPQLALKLIVWVLDLLAVALLLRRIL